MNAVELNWLAIAVAAVVSYGIGALWYTVLFGKRWMALTGLTEEQLQDGVTSPAVAMGGEAVRVIVTTVVLAIVVSWSGAATVVTGAAVGAMLCIAFVIGETSKLVLFEHRPFQLFLLNNGYNVVALVLSGAILAAWQ